MPSARGGRRNGRSLLVVKKTALLFVLLAAACAVLLGIAGYFGLLNSLVENILSSPDRYRRVVCVFGVHLGGYIGAAAGAVLVIWRILRLRRQRVPVGGSSQD